MTSEALRTLSLIPLFAGRAFDRLDIERLGGLTNRAYRIVADGESFVLRVPGEGTEQHIDRRREHHNMSIAAAIGLTPEILYYDDGSGVMVTRFVADGTVLTPAAMQNREVLRAAVLTLRKLHQCGHQFEGILDPFAKIDQYIAIAAQVGTIPMPGDLPPALLVAQELRRRFAEETPAMTPCHVDPSPENMIIRGPATDGNIVLVDWEYSEMCDPLWDLADFSREAGLSEAQDRDLVEIYFGPADRARYRQFCRFKSVAHLIGAAWALMQAAVTGKTDKFTVDYATDLMEFRRLTESE